MADFVGLVDGAGHEKTVQSFSAKTDRYWITVWIVPRLLGVHNQSINSIKRISRYIDISSECVAARA